MSPRSKRSMFGVWSSLLMTQAIVAGLAMDAGSPAWVAAALLAVWSGYRMWKDEL